MAMVKKKECEERALKIVYQLIEPKVDCIWLLENVSMHCFIIQIKIKF